jgi:Uma2 family endonuclease
MEMMNMLKPPPVAPPQRIWPPLRTREAPAPDEGNYVAEAEYWQTYYDLGDLRYEWNNGFLEAKPVTDYVKYLMYGWLVDLLKDFLHVYPVARLIGLEMGFRLVLPHKVTIRKPDLGVVLNSNPVPLGNKDRTYGGIFDLCIESLSDSSQWEIDRDTIVKKAEYAEAGVREYYILDDQKTETAFYQLNAQGQYVPLLPDANGVIRSVILPGFQFRVDDLYQRPLPPEMIADPVYNAFVSPYYRAERERAEQAELELLHKNQELARKDQALLDKDEKIAELMAKLKQAGLSPD